ncbi:hypothetical protein Z949_3002 [Sulfitobacter guttiformis KCTC 32187]|uniref:Uncharacterized protein n=1 Tax=Sulfitobacter guttiformis TaxID=74349 RepID=A0A420DQ48_9RHOB|nr:hypothetical protein Z949_3002 [Sulfitobacter guttiformis KCTC 32187]RKE96444.1 hypothetical protein C8N30_1003 [Sulfitobacter guttiformis]
MPQRQALVPAFMQVYASLMMRINHIGTRHVLLAFLTLALLSLPFAHRAGAAPMTSQMTQFLAMGGEPSDLCGDRDIHLAGGCESCRIVGEMLLPLPTQSKMPSSPPVRMFVHQCSQPVLSQPKPYISPPVRAPPSA